MPSTEENLKVAFAGESEASRKYTAFATQAERDGFPNIARLFRTTADAERLHAEGHLKAMGAERPRLERKLTTMGLAIGAGGGIASDAMAIGVGLGSPWRAATACRNVACKVALHARHARARANASDSHWQNDSRE